MIPECNNSEAPLQPWVTCTNCGQSFKHMGTNDSWICDDCFYGYNRVKCSVCGEDTDDFYSPESGVICHNCVEAGS